MTTTNESEAPRHVFEIAGLGVAPFRFTGHERLVFQAIPGDPNCPIQPGGSCDFCGQAIYTACWISDVNGKRFKVGCDCVRKTGDAGLIKRVNKIRAAADAKRRESRAQATSATLEALLEDESVRAQLAAQPHPQAWAAEQGRTLLDYALYMMERAGKSGRARLERTIRKALA